MEVCCNVVNKYLQAVACQMLSSKARAYYASASDDEISNISSSSEGNPNELIILNE